MAAEDVAGYDAHKGLAQSAFAAVSNALGLNTPAATVTAPGQDAAVTTPAATEAAPATESRADRPASTRAAAAEPSAQPAYDPAAEAMRMYATQRQNQAMMGGGGGDLLGNGGNPKAQVFGPQAPSKQQPSFPGPGGRGRA